MAIALSPEPRLGQPFNILVSGENTVYRYVKVPEGVEVLPDQPDVIAMTAPVYDFTRTGTIQLQINAPGTYTIDVLALAPPSGDGQARDARRAQVEISDQGTVVTISNISSDGFLLIPASPTP